MYADHVRFDPSHPYIERLPYGTLNVPKTSFIHHDILRVILRPTAAYSVSYKYDVIRFRRRPKLGLEDVTTLACPKIRRHISSRDITAKP